MNIERQGLVLLALSLVFILGASYNLVDVLQWHLRKVEARGTITAIEGYSAENRPRSRGACLQTLHYKFSGPDGREREGKDSIWWGDCRHRVGGSLVVYHDRNVARSITKTGLDSRRGWMFLLAVFSAISFFIGGFVVAMTRTSPRPIGVSPI
jgi:hypothetical protein